MVITVLKAFDIVYVTTRGDLETNLLAVKMLDEFSKYRNIGREIIHTENKNINLKHNDPLLYFIQRIRDEAHRFAITSHRSRRKNSAFRSIFDEIPNIGPKRKKLLNCNYL